MPFPFPINRNNEKCQVSRCALRPVSVLDRRLLE